MALTFPIQHVVALSPSLVVRLLDPCGKQSQICSSMVDSLRLPVSIVDGVRICRFTVASSYDFQQSMSLSAMVTNLEHVSTPNESVPTTIKDAFQGFALADPAF